MSTMETELDLSDSNITDEQLAEKLNGLSNLEWLDLDGTQVTDAGVQELQEVLPDCAISL